MKTLSLDLRERILAAYDAEQGSREEIGRRFRVSTGMVKKLLQQRRKRGTSGPNPTVPAASRCCWTRTGSAWTR